MEKNFYHLFANGDDAKDFITSEQDFKTAFNRFGICQYLTGVTVLSFSVEDSHPHCLLYDTYEKCVLFKDKYTDLSKRSIVQQRGSLDDVNIHCELALIEDEQYLMNAAAYTITQATKDGKAVMPYDYRYGTGALYFRSRYSVLPWLVDDEGHVRQPERIGDLAVMERRRILASKVSLPDDWLVCNGFLLPTNYVDIQKFEQIYKTHNCFRVFMCGTKQKDDQIKMNMSKVRGIMIEDLEARALCRSLCMELFGRMTTRQLNTQQRIHLAQQLRRRYGLSSRQISMLVKIPEAEIRKYL